MIDSVSDASIIMCLLTTSLLSRTMFTVFCQAVQIVQIGNTLFVSDKYIVLCALIIGASGKAFCVGHFSEIHTLLLCLCVGQFHRELA